eukprot:1865984-Karenia_brevis.AAC.1
MESSWGATMAATTLYHLGWLSGGVGIQFSLRSKLVSPYQKIVRMRAPTQQRMADLTEIAHWETLTFHSNIFGARIAMANLCIALSSMRYKHLCLFEPIGLTEHTLLST